MNRYLLLLILLGYFSISGFCQPGCQFIVIDQFGYPPTAKKVAVIRDPQTGFDSEQSFLPGSIYAVVEISTGSKVFEAAPVAWNSGKTDEASGDRVWHFDFSTVNKPGTYYILDEEKGQRSYNFIISANVYNEVLKQAVRTFFYQRAGCEKTEEFAGSGWADEASHMKDLQDANCRSFFDKNNPATERDVSGGWFDAGDYNKYTNWTANYIVGFMDAYIENPEAFGDNYNIPESGNGIPDLLDEAKWGLDHLLRMQNEDGSVLSIVGLSGGSPPSSATGPSYYGPPNTSATLNTSAAFALSAMVFDSIGMNEYADTLLERSKKAWDWAILNPAVLFDNNSSNYNSEGLGAGQQEVDDYTRLMIKIEAACYLFDLTGETKYRDFFDANYTQCHLIAWNYAYPFELENQKMLLHYLRIPGGTSSVKNKIRTIFKNSILNGTDNLPANRSMKDPYFAYIKDYTWGTNRIKSVQGSMYMDLLEYDFAISTPGELIDAGMTYLNYLHGVNPLSFVYLSNMYTYGADNGVNEFYHSWFTDGSPLWDRVGTSTFGPPPGYLTGGANPGYDWDGCCPEGCGSTGNNSKCYSESISPPKGQPKMKSYKDFNTSWPLNSWSVTENSCGYQIEYIRLLSKFVVSGMDCNGDVSGTAYIDSCGVCAGGNTGITPVIDAGTCIPDTDCEGIIGGAAYIDSCGVCSGGSTGRIPVISNDECYDCNGDYNGEAFLDSCKNCAGGNTGNEPVLDILSCFDCNDEFNGSAFLDSCGICSGGSSGNAAILDPDLCTNVIFKNLSIAYSKIQVYPNPNYGILFFIGAENLNFRIKIFDVNGAVILERKVTGKDKIDLHEIGAGFYEILMVFPEGVSRKKLIIV